MLIGWKARTTDPSVASFRYRVQVPIGLLQARGHAVELFDEVRLEHYDLVVFSKAYSAEDQALARRLRDCGRQVVLDICDNHFYNPFGLAIYDERRGDLLRMAALCTTFVCSTPALARVLMTEAALKDMPAVVGDVVEDAGVIQGAGWPQGARRLLWFGVHGSVNAPSGMTGLLKIAPLLERAHAATEFELVVVSNSRKKFDRHIAGLPFPTRYVDWAPEAFRQELAGARAVLLPLSDNPFVACKTHNRLTLALAAGVPVIADPIESYLEFAPYVWLSEWEAGLEAVLGDDPAPVRERMRQARAYLDAHWSQDLIATQWETAIGLAPTAL